MKHFILTIAIILANISCNIMPKMYVNNDNEPENYFDINKRIQKYFQIDTIIDVNFTDPKNPANIKPYCIYNNHVLILVEQDSNIVKFIHYYIPERKIDTLTAVIGYEDFIKADSYWLSYQNITCNDKYLIIAVYNKVVVFENSNFQKFVYKDILMYHDGFTKTYLLKSVLYLVKCNYYPLKTEPHMKITKLCLDKYEIVKSILPDFTAPEFCFLAPRNWADANTDGTRILFANTLNYRIAIYDKELNLTDTLVRKPKYWKDITNPKLEKVLERNRQYEKDSNRRMQTGEYMKDIMEVNRGEGSRVISSKFIDDSTIIVHYSSWNPQEKKQYTFYCDIWRYKKNGWELIEGDLADMIPLKDIIFSRETFPFMGAVFIPEYYNGYAVSLKLSASSFVMLNKNSNYGDIFDAQEDYFSDNSLTSQLYIYKWVKDEK